MHSGDNLCHPTPHNPSSFFLLLLCAMQRKDMGKMTRNQLFIRLWPLTEISVNILCPALCWGLAELLGMGDHQKMIQMWISRDEILHPCSYTREELPGSPVCDSFPKCCPQGQGMLHKHQQTMAGSHLSSPSPCPCQATISTCPKRERIVPSWSLRDWTKEKLNVMKWYIGSLKIAPNAAQLIFILILKHNYTTLLINCLQTSMFKSAHLPQISYCSQAVSYTSLNIKSL